MDQRLVLGEIWLPCGSSVVPVELGWMPETSAPDLSPISQ
jgi:hypothetical protein